MRDFIEKQLGEFKRANGRAYRLGIVNFGGTFTCLKIGDYLTAKYKAQAVLALMDQFRIDKTERRAFFGKMMATPFGREMLPNN